MKENESWKTRKAVRSEKVFQFYSLYLHDFQRGTR